MKSKDKPIEKKCRFCPKVVKSLYENQAEYNIKAHELACPENPENKKRRGK